MIVDAMPIQNTAFDASRLFTDPVSWSVCFPLRAAVFTGTGNERLIGDALRIQRIPR